MWQDQENFDWCVTTDALLHFTVLGQTSFLQQHYLTLKSDAAIPYP